MILNLLLNTQMIWMIFMEILKNTIQIKNEKKLIAFGDPITDMLSNKNLNKIVTELLIRGRKLNSSLVSITQSFCCSKKYQTKFYTTFYYENSK